MDTLIDLDGLSRFLYNLREENKPFYVNGSYEEENNTTTYTCKFSDIVKAWNSGIPIYFVSEDNLQCLITEYHDDPIDPSSTYFRFHHINDWYILYNNG